MRDYINMTVEDLVRGLAENPPDTPHWVKCWSELQRRRDQTLLRFQRWMVIFGGCVALNALAHLAGLILSK